MDEIDQIKTDFEEALKRLREGKPRNKSLQQKQRVGKLRVNIFNVALEASRSRTLIGTDDCKYLEVRLEILKLRPKKAEKVASVQEIAIRRSRENRDLKAENRLLLSHNAALIIALEDRDRALFRLEGRRAMPAPENETTPLVGGNVHRLRPKRGST